jgi:hypothetical protein
MGKANPITHHAKTPPQPRTVPTTPPAEEQVELPIFNTKQLTNEAIDSLQHKVFMECVHLKESRKDPQSDFEGYTTKMQVDGVVGYVFLKTCSACAPKEDTDRTKIVARLRYGMLSDFTLKAMFKNQGTKRMVPLTPIARKLAAEAETEGPSTIN